MDVVSATLYDFAAVRRARLPLPERDLNGVLERIERSCASLAEIGINVIGFTKPLSRRPYVTVAAKPAVYMLFSGRYESLGHKQDGALRYEVWEARDTENDVDIRWVEVIACA